MLGSFILGFLLLVGSVFLILSILASAVVEWINRLLGTRAYLFKQWVLNLDDVKGREIYGHPAISCMLAGSNACPSFVDPKSFASAVLTTSAPSILGEKQPPQVMTPAEALAGQTATTDDGFSVAFNALRLAAPTPLAGLPTLTVQELPRTILDRLIPFSRSNTSTVGPMGDSFRVLLLDLWATSTTFAEASKALADWFQKTQERLGGQYKRIAQGQLFVVGLLLAYYGGFDANSVLASCWNSARADAVAPKPITPPTPPDKKDLLAGKPVAETPAPAHHPEPKPTEVATSPGATTDADKSLILPFQSKDQNPPILGCLMMAFLIALGANFWFDLLNRLTKINLRQAGKAPSLDAGLDKLLVEGT